MTLDLTKPLMIAGVGPVRLLTSEGRTTGYPIIAELEDGMVLRFGVDGESIGGSMRLINAPEPPLTTWLVVYSSGALATFQSETAARQWASGLDGSRLFRIEIHAGGGNKIVEDEMGGLWRFTSDGCVCGGPRLINAPEPPLTAWLVVYSSGALVTFQSETAARQWASGLDGSRLFRIEIHAGGGNKIEEVK